MVSNTDNGQPWYLSGSDVSQLVRDKKISSVEVVESQLQRIDDVNAKINAIVADGSHDGREIESIREELLILRFGGWLSM